MLLLAFAFILLLLAAWRLLRPQRSQPHVQTTHIQAKQPSRGQRMIEEAFEFLSSSTVDAATEPSQANCSLPRKNVLVMYATEYGFAREVARKAASLLAKSPALRPRVVNALNYACIDFQRENTILLVSSTTGDGVPPNEAEDLCAALREGIVPPNPKATLAVLALGDQSYPHFCRGGILLEELICRALCVKPAFSRGEVNQEDWEFIETWLGQFLRIIEGTESVAVPESKDSTSGDMIFEEDYLPAAMQKFAMLCENTRDVTRHSRNMPYMACISSRTILTQPNSSTSSYAVSSSTDINSKLVIRVEFDVSDAEFPYIAGDALGVVPRNNPDLVEGITRALAASGEEPVVIGSGRNESITDTLKQPAVPLKHALMDVLDLRTVRPELIDAVGVATDNAQERSSCVELLGRQPGVNPSGPLTTAGKSYAESRDVLDVLSDFVGARLTPAELVRTLRPLTARYYSISSTPVTSPNRVAITVDVLRYLSLNIPREGVASTYMNHRVVVNEDKVGIFVSKNNNFRLPPDGSKPIVMIGPGTGIAPFVAFIEERAQTFAPGRNILFFGCRHAEQDFLYRDWLENHVKQGQLEVFTAFSRDQPAKVYVQHRLIEKAVDIWHLMNAEGAHFYICGDGRRMAPDVEATLIRIVEEQGGLSTTKAIEYLNALAESRRLQKDVWIP